MAITRWDRFGEVTNMRREFDRLLGRLGVGAGEQSGRLGAWIPQIDVKTQDGDMVVYAEVPGIDREDIEVEVSESTLTIKGQRRTETEKTEEGWLIRERSHGTFERKLALPEGAEADKITAEYKDGVLEVRVPRAAEALEPKVRKIEIGAPPKESEST